ncbi:hypothetical protein RJ639_012751 [Escallonia herrerae]|uniref:Pectinesterase n=1 Tax=Escallonia herrerae TaxID=1293975 RepID=A0AA88VNZ0_9ASTE|nr:hypothetical protein RJ639_012751 [Escallonia herrerae]
MELLLSVTILLGFLASAQTQSPRVDLTVAKDGTGNFTTIGEAILAAPSYSKRRYYIRIRAGKYTENIQIEEMKTNLIFIGDGMDHTIISGNRSRKGGYTTYKTSTVGIRGPGFIAQGITFENTAGPQMDQAVALRSEAEKITFFQCRFLGYQDTLYTKSGVQFFRDCEIFGTVDFIFGDATVILQNCAIFARKPLPWQSNTITAEGRDSANLTTGIVIHNCSITAAPDLRQHLNEIKTYLGRPWKHFSRTVIMQTFIDELIDPQGWLIWKGQPLGNPYFAEYGNTGHGARTNERVKWGRVINSTREAAQFTVRNFIHGETWIPSTGIPFFLDLL